MICRSIQIVFGVYEWLKKRWDIRCSLWEPNGPSLLWWDRFEQRGAYIPLYTPPPYPPSTQNIHAFSIPPEKVFCHPSPAPSPRIDFKKALRISDRAFGWKGSIKGTVQRYPGTQLLKGARVWWTISFQADNVMVLPKGRLCLLCIAIVSWLVQSPLIRPLSWNKSSGIFVSEMVLCWRVYCCR
jgi:hypothetical protein